jgi:hypothetical protein
LHICEHLLPHLECHYYCLPQLRSSYGRHIHITGGKNRNKADMSIPQAEFVL